MTTVSLEVALLEHEAGGVKLLGRSDDPDLIERVRAHLTRKLHRAAPRPAEANLRLVESDDGSEDRAD